MVSPPSPWFASCPACPDLASSGKPDPRRGGGGVLAQTCQRCCAPLTRPCPHCLPCCRKYQGGLGPPAFPCRLLLLRWKAHSQTSSTGRCSYISSLAQVPRGTFCPLLTGLSSGSCPRVDGLHKALMYVPAAVHSGLVTVLQCMSSGQFF